MPEELGVLLFSCFVSCIVYAHIHIYVSESKAKFLHQRDTPTHTQKKELVA